VNVVLVWPFVPVLVDVDPKIPAVAGETVQFTVCPASTFPLGSLTFTTSGNPSGLPGLATWAFPLTTVTDPTLAGDTFILTKFDSIPTGNSPLYKLVQVL
jgi:hypothetical protein